MRRTLVFVLAAVSLAGGCSSTTSKPAAAPQKAATTSVAAPATPTTAAASTSSVDHTVEALECGMFDLGAVYLNDEWPAIIGGHPRIGYGLNLERAADTWQKGLNNYSTDTGLDTAVGRAESGVHDMETAMAQATGSGPVEIGGEVLQIRDAFMVAGGICADIGYHMTQPLKEK